MSRLIPKTPLRGENEIRAILPEIDGLGVIAGGWAAWMILPGTHAKVVRPPQDIDIFPYTLLGFALMKGRFSDLGWKMESQGKYHCTYRHPQFSVAQVPLPKVQIIDPGDPPRPGTYGGIRAIVEGFDLTVCQAAVDGDKVVATDECMADQTNLTVMLVPGFKITNTLRLFNRLAKYAGKGYKIHHTAIKSMFEAYCELRETGIDPEDVWPEFAGGGYAD